MKLNNRFIFGILSLLLAAVIAFVALPTIARQTNGKEEIVRITQPVLKGEQISSENAEVVEVGGYNLPSNIAHQLFKTYRHTYLILGSALVGMVVLVAGQLVVERIYHYAVPISVFITVGGGVYFLYLLLSNRRV